MFDLDYTKKAQEIQDWIATTVRSAGFEKVILAVSGGVDSAVSLSLAVKALGKENVYAVLLPYGTLSSASLEHGKLVVESAGLPKDHVFVRDIQSGVDKLWSVIANEAKQSDTNDEIAASQAPRNDTSIRRGNMMARVRMIYLFDLAKSLGALVVGTENKSEHYLGYFTRFGDEASDIEPIRSLYKTQVWEMAKSLGVPKEIIEKKPSAGLWENQSDEGEFGFSYTDADKVLYFSFEEKKSQEEIIALGFDKKLVENVLGFARKNDFKHHVPYIFE
ncbi:MAG TPA: NAD+ synthase [Patescibacteria group bacterium]|nr:NAD+ synthase [Patescibacteria group bacterium]